MDDTDEICATCGEWPLRCRCGERPAVAPEPERQICPDCHGTTLNLLDPNDGGTCPSCFGGYVR
jgi:hypothetical protein